MATQNPIETEGTYPLPEAQVDRFMLKVVVGYPTVREEYVIVERMTGTALPPQPVLTTAQLIELQNIVDEVYVDPALMEYAVQVVDATREPAKYGLRDMGQYITYGASPRASINLILAARALAFIRGRNYVLPQDVTDEVLDVLRHRLVLSYEALSANVTSEALLRRVMSQVPAPVQVLHEHVRVDA
jgi:MoxR-like ATPase